MMDTTMRTASERLLKVAQSDTRQSRRVSSFVLARWSTTDHGGFDTADLFAVDAEIRDMTTVFSYLVGRPTAQYPEAYRVEIEAVIRRWRPEVWERYAESA